MLKYPLVLLNDSDRLRAWLSKNMRFLIDFHERDPIRVGSGGSNFDHVFSIIPGPNALSRNEGIFQAVSLFEELLAGGLASDWHGDSRERVRAALARVPNLAPGDFAAVARRAQALRQQTVGELVTALLETVRIKRRSRRTLGFSLESTAEPEETRPRTF